VLRRLVAAARHRSVVLRRQAAAVRPVSRRRSRV